MTITRTADNCYTVVTDTVLADGTMRADYAMRLVGNVLRSIEERGTIRIGGLMRVTLGPVTLARVQALSVGETLAIQVKDTK